MTGAYKNVTLSSLAGSDPPRLGGRARPREFGPGWLGMAGRDGKS